MIFNKFFSEIFNLFYPSVCYSCGKSLVKGESHICTKCRFDIAKTNFSNEDNNPVEEVFWGKVNLYSATAYCFYSKGGIMKNLLHKLKYKSKPEIGVELGKMLAGEISELEKYKTIDYIIPLPLHPTRQHKRGYNQSKMIALGMNVLFSKSINDNNLIRVIATDTQTKKNRYQRFENVKGIFNLRNPKEFEAKHVLLVDDVLTTGSTLVAAAETLLQVKDIKVSIACVAFAKSI